MPQGNSNNQGLTFRIQIPAGLLTEAVAEKQTNGFVSVNGYKINGSNGELAFVNELAKAPTPKRKTTTQVNRNNLDEMLAGYRKSLNTDANRSKRTLADVLPGEPTKRVLN